MLRNSITDIFVEYSSLYFFFSFCPLIADTSMYQGFCFPEYISRTFSNGVILMFTAASRLKVLSLFLVWLLLLPFSFPFFFIAFLHFLFLSAFLLIHFFNIHVYFEYAVMIQVEPKSIQYLINTWYWIVSLTDIDPIQDRRRGGVRGQKGSPTSFSS